VDSKSREGQALIKAVASYHTLRATSDLSRSESAIRQSLDQVVKSALAYANTRSPEATSHGMASIPLKLTQALAAETEALDRWRQPEPEVGLSPAQRQALADAGASKAFIEAAIHEPLSAAQADELVHLVTRNSKRIDYEAATQWLNSGSSIAVLTRLLKSGYGIGKNTLPQEFSPERMLSVDKRGLGAGAVNTVYPVRYRIDDRKASERKTDKATSPQERSEKLVFKEDFLSGEREIGAASEGVGIPRIRPKFAGRSVGTANVAALLGLGLVPKTALAVLPSEKVGSVMGFAEGLPPGPLGRLDVRLPEAIQATLDKASESERHRLIREFAARCGFSGDASGRVATLEQRSDGFYLRMAHRVMRSPLESKEGESPAPATPVDQPIIAAFDASSGRLRKELTQAQWLDLLVGQVDRNPQNLFIKTDHKGQPEKLTLIDNDASFGEKISDPAALGKYRASYAAKIPTVIDAQTHARILAMTPAQLDDALQGLVSEAEIAAAKSRLDHLQKHLTQSPPATRILESDDAWAAPEVATALGIPENFTVDHLAKEVEAAAKAGEGDLGRKLREIDRSADNVRKSSYLAREATMQIAESAIREGLRRAIASAADSAAPAQDQAGEAGQAALDTGALTRAQLELYLESRLPMYDPRLFGDQP
jgi:hypothetical protein